MLDTAERVKRVNLRIKELEDKREKKQINLLGSLCLVLLLSLIGSLGVMTGGGQAGMVAGLYGSMLLYEGAGSYVFVSVLSFSLAVVITTIYMKYLKNKEI